MISTAASVAASVMLLRSFSRDFVPPELRRFASGKLRAFLASFSNDLTLVIEEFDGLNRNHLFTAAEAYLGHSNALSSSSTTFRLKMHPKERTVSVSIDGNESIVDTFDGVTLTWRLIRRQIPATYAPNRSDRFNNPKVHAEIRYFELRFHKKHRKAVLDRYLKHVVEESKSIGVEKKSLKLFTLKDDRIRPRRLANTWQGVDLDHPATFDTVAMEAAEAKKAVMEDLERFVRRKDLYRKVGKAWKRGYLLFGPPGTGKSSLIAAMANFLKFDVYDLGLVDLGSNSELRRLLIATANRSILVVEDIDCSIELQNRARKVELVRTHHHHHLSVRSQGRSQVTLSGLLNFIDGLWSSCGDERIIVFTTNHKDRLDPALLRPGRMDVHIRMSYCSPCGFRMLASNYLGIEEHPLFSDVEELVGMTRVTPAEVGEELMKNEEPEIALRGLVRFLEHKIASNETEEARNVEGDEVSKEGQQHDGGH